MFVACKTVDRDYVDYYISYSRSETGRSGVVSIVLIRETTYCYSSRFAVSMTSRIQVSRVWAPSFFLYFSGMPFGTVAA